MSVDLSVPYVKPLGVVGTYLVLGGVVFVAWRMHKKRKGS